MDYIVERIWDNIPKKVSKKPIAIFMMGLPASGKSTSIIKVSELLKLDVDSLIHVDPDIFMSKLDEYIYYHITVASDLKCTLKVQSTIYCQYIVNTFLKLNLLKRYNV